MTDADAAALDAILSSPHRSPAHRARDSHRHPRETLGFFGLAADMHVVEIWPITGWYTEILAPFLKDRGRLTCAHFPADHREELLRRQRAEFVAKLAGAPGIYGAPTVTAFGKDRYDYAPDGSADMVLTIRNLHNWMWSDYLAPVLASFLRVLKPGGVLGLEEHRGDPAKPQDPQARDCYVRQDVAIALVTAAGFVFEAATEINANPRDTKDHPRGALSLPPVLRGVESDPARYLAIGESDRMTLRFRKPG
ncbi:MAG: methyltransferase [Rhodospirillaceae bacterium]|nr:methyltransferase [Rhodospirillaceae bacterium]